MSWNSKSVCVGATVGSLRDALHDTDGGITGDHSFGLSLTDQIDAFSFLKCGQMIASLLTNECSSATNLQTFMTRRTTYSLHSEVTQWAHSGGIDVPNLHPFGDGGLDVSLGYCSWTTPVYQVKRRRWSAEDVQHSWANLAELRWERDRFRNASSNVRSWVTYLNDYVSRIWYGREDSWTREFLKLDASVLEKDDWALAFQYPELSDPEVVPLIRGWLLDSGEHFKKVSDLLQDLRQLLIEVEGVTNHFGWLCQLGASLLVSFYRCCSLFVSQRSWFLHHSAHPPHARNPHIPGFGGAGALLQLPS